MQLLSWQIPCWCTSSKVYLKWFICWKDSSREKLNQYENVLIQRAKVFQVESRAQWLVNDCLPVT